MSGVSISWQFEDREVQKAFRALEKAFANPAPIMRVIGSGLVDGTRRRFVEARDPDGQSWKALSPDYAAIKRGPGILRESAIRGGLMGSITRRATADSVEVGTNKVYGAIHQFGGTIRAKNPKGLFFFLSGGAVRPKSVTIPARPYLGISAEDEDMTLDVIEGAIKRATS